MQQVLAFCTTTEMHISCVLSKQLICTFFPTDVKKNRFSLLQTPRQSFFTGSRRETGFKDFQRLCDDFVRRTSTIKPQLKRQCIEKTDSVKTPSWLIVFKKVDLSFFPSFSTVIVFPLVPKKGMVRLLKKGT